MFNKRGRRSKQTRSKLRRSKIRRSKLRRRKFNQSMLLLIVSKNTQTDRYY